MAISTRLRLGFGCMLMLVVAVAALGQWSGAKVHQQMRHITGIGAQKAQGVDAMLGSLSVIGLQSRSAAMLNEIDAKQAHTQIEAVGKTLKEYEQQEAFLAQLMSPGNATPAEIELLDEVRALARKTRPELDAAIKAADDGDTVLSLIHI